MGGDSEVKALACAACPVPIRWAGGKRLLVHRLRALLPPTWRTFYEPMVGSGALFFSCQPTIAVLGDINEELIVFYRTLRRTPRALAASVNKIRPLKGNYYRIRSSNPSTQFARAVRFYYLIRLAWNGLYRVNRDGHFNVPYGRRRPKVLLPPEMAVRVAAALQGVTLVQGDFEVTAAGAKAGDLVYFDPPYPKGAANNNGFARYHETGFGLEDHKRLARFAATLADRGVLVLITEAARKDILRHYSRSFHTRLVRTQSLIAGDGADRGRSYEAVLTSYLPGARRDK